MRSSAASTPTAPTAPHAGWIGSATPGYVPRPVRSLARASRKEESPDAYLGRDRPPARRRRARPRHGRAGGFPSDPAACGRRTGEEGDREADLLPDDLPP